MSKKKGKSKVKNIKLIEEYEITPLGWFANNLSVPEAQELLNELYRYLLKIDKNAMVFDKGEITFEKVKRYDKSQRSGGMMK